MGKKVVSSYAFFFIGEFGNCHITQKHLDPAIQGFWDSSEEEALKYTETLNTNQ